MGFANEDPDDDGQAIRDQRLEDRADAGTIDKQVMCPICKEILPVKVVLGSSIFRAKDNVLRSHNIRKHKGEAVVVERCSACGSSAEHHLDYVRQHGKCVV